MQLTESANGYSLGMLNTPYTENSICLILMQQLSLLIWRIEAKYSNSVHMQAIVSMHALACEMWAFWSDSLQPNSD